MRKSIAGMLAAGLVVAASLFVVGAPAGAVTVSDEAALRVAYADVNETQIDLANDITLTDCAAGDLGRNSATALTLDGHGFTITQTCTNERVVSFFGGGAFTLENVTITGGNMTSGTGGGGINASDVTLVNSTVRDNSANDFGGAMNVQSAVLINSTVSGNESAGRAGGIAADVATLTNSTVTGNTATTGGGPLTGGGGLYVNEAILVYSTIVGNTAPSFANVNANVAITSFGSVVALPQGGGESCGGGGATTSNGYNFSDDSSCDFTDATDQQDAGDPGLGALGDNGGPTQTLLPQTGSPLIDTIPVDACQADGASDVTSDQRGIARPQGGGCDRGSVEVEVLVPVPVPVVVVPTFTG